MYPSIAVVYDNPFGVGHSVGVIWLVSAIFADILLDAVGDGSHLSGGIALRDDECVCGSRFYVAHIHHCDGTAFAFLNTFYDEFLEVFIGRH